MTNARAYHTASVLNNGKVLVCGGLINIYSLISAELYDPLTGNWTITGSMTNARAYHTASVLNNGKVLVCGGFSNGYNLVSAELYDPLTGNWTIVGRMADARSRHTASVLNNGSVLVCGGNTQSSTDYYLNSAELYDPSTGNWTTTRSMADARRDHTASVLNNGNVLVCGGLNDYGYLNSAELYDPSTGNWATTGNIT
mgnify:FL=1